tara:strand:+ start:150 stop:374 length:225 start_codon:yes stop_codon:yes gene_type:complete
VSILTNTTIILEEIIIPGANSFRGMNIEEFKAEVYDMVTSSSVGIGQDLAVFVLEGADWDFLYIKMQSLTIKNK